jgi:CHAD domain-containing protein
VRAGDVEAVHDMRVATRRLRAALDAARPLAKDRPFRRQYRAVKGLADALGGVRDRDVLLETLRARLAGAAPDERPGLESLIAAIAAEREEHRRELLATLDRWREEDLAGDFGRFAAKSLKQKGGLTVAEAAARALATHLDEFDERADAFATPDDAEALHDLRIVAKRLRYTLELFGAPLGEATAAALLDELKGLQEGLGTLHDRDVLAAVLRDERRGAARRERDELDRAAAAPGPREERRAAVRARLRAPGSFAATAPGIYGLLADASDERRAVYADLHRRWEALEREGFRGRLRALGQPAAG